MSGLNYHCEEVESQLCDYLDGTLTPSARQAFETHLAACPECGELVRDCAEATAFIERCAVVEPPPELLTRIMHQLPAAQAQARRRRGFSGWLGKLFEPILQPRFAMGMAMTILSFSMLGKFVGPVKPIRAADLDPVKIVQTIDDKLHRTWNSAVKYYESLRLVYEIQSALRDMRDADDEAAAPPANPDAGGSKSEEGTK
jgi:anti-sigma factor (TIGR02949 family)